MNGYNFTERVRKCLALAREESVRLKHEYVGTEHMLLDLIAEGEGVAAAVMTNLHAEMQPRTRARSAWTPPLPRVTPRLKGVLSQARELAPHPDAITPVMIAVTLIRQREGAMRAVLEFLDLDIDRLLDELVPVMEKEIADTEGANPSERADAVRRLVLTANSERDAEDELCSTAHVLVALVLTSPAVAEAVLAQGVKPDDVRKALSRLSG